MKLHWFALALWLLACGTTAPKEREAATPPVIGDGPALPTADASRGELPPMQPRIMATEQAETLRTEGLDLIQSVSLAEGAKKLRESLVFLANQPEVRRVLVGAYMRLGRSMDAMQITDDWIRKSPDDRAAVQLRADVLMRTDRLGDSRLLLERFLERNPDDLDFRNQLSRVYVMMGFHGKAIRESTTVLKADQVNVEAMTNVARAYLAQNKRELARFVIGQALEVSETPELYHLGARVYIEAGNWQQAEGFLRKATDLDGDFPEAFNNLGVVYQQVGDYQSAVVSLEKAVRVAPGYREAFLNLGNAYRGLKEYTKAQDAYESALRLDNRYASAYFNLGILFFENQVEGMDDERRLQLVVENFNQYKRVIGSMIPKNDRADRYIEEARRIIEEVRKAKAEELKQPAADDALDDMESDDGLDGGDGDASAPDEPAEAPPSELKPTEPVEPDEPVTPDSAPTPAPQPIENPEKAPKPAPIQPEPDKSPAPIPAVEPDPEEDRDKYETPEPSPEPEEFDPEPDPNEIPVPDEG